MVLRRTTKKWFHYLPPTRWMPLLFLVQILAVFYFWDSFTSNPPVHKVSTFGHHVMSDFENERSRHYFIVLGILSDRNSWEKRWAVRETWLRLGKARSYPVLHKFVIGQPYCVMQQIACDERTQAQEAALADEAEAYGDILRVRVPDTYNALSEKVCALLEWASMHDFTYFVKTDHDIFVRLDTIISELREVTPPRTRYWSGYAWRDTVPIHDPKDKNRDMSYNLGKFPPYTAGALYILSSDLVYGLSSTLPRRYYMNEDQSLGIWLLPFNITPHHDPRIQQWDVCHNTMIAKHPLTPQGMRDMYANVRNGQDMCKGFNTKVCPVCYECEPGQVHWQTSELGCDKNGVFVANPALLAAPPEAPCVVPKDDVMAGVAGYLPYVSCKRRQIEDVQRRDNYVRNGQLNTQMNMEWEMTGGVDIVEDGMFDFSGDPSASCVRLVPPTTHDSHMSYISQVLEIRQTTPEPLVMSAWSKAQDVDTTNNPEDYSLFANIIYSDGTDFGGFAVDFHPGTHDWEYNARVFNPDKPVARIEIYCLFRFHAGVVWFDNVRVASLSDGICDLKFQSQFFLPSFAPPSLTTGHHPPPPQGLTFIVIWTTKATSFRLRHRRVIESIFYHHPDARVKMYSNTLPLYFFQRFTSAGYWVEVVRYDLKSLASGLPGERWLANIEEWQQGESFYAHLADFLRFVLLFRDGGVYTDMDSILIRPIDETNIIGVEHCDEDSLDYCIKLPQFDHDTRFYLPIGFLVLAPSHPLIYGALTFFDTRYNPNLWPCGTIYLTLAYAKIALAHPGTPTREELTNVLPARDDLVRILPREAFYPIPWQRVRPYFEDDDAALWAQITSDSYAFHIWGKMTSDLRPTSDSLLWRVLTQFAISNDAESQTLL